MNAVSALLPDGKRLHLQHGPIDLVIGAEGQGDAKQRAFRAASMRFETVLTELVGELDVLRTPISKRSSKPHGQIAQHMYTACLPHSTAYVTPMAAVAGAVADTVLQAMTDSTDLARAYVNNGGDIAFHLATEHSFSMAMQNHEAADLGKAVIQAFHTSRGIATSGRHGRSLSLGIADSVTVLAQDAAQADVAATLIANAIDLPGHPAITRQPANTLDPDSDLTTKLVVTECGLLTDTDKNHALRAGGACAQKMQNAGLIHAAALFLQGQSHVIGSNFEPTKRSLVYA